MRKAAPVLGAGFAMLLLAACSSGPATIKSHGTVTVFVPPGNGLNAQSAYPDIADGGQVAVGDSSGKVIGTGTLAYNPGQTQAMLRKATAGSGLTASELTSFVAEYDFAVTVPGGLTRYGIKIGQNRGTIYESAARMKNPSLTLGSLTG